MPCLSVLCFVSMYVSVFFCTFYCIYVIPHHFYLVLHVLLLCLLLINIQYPILCTLNTVVMRKLFVIVAVGTYKLVGKQAVTEVVDAALSAGYRLIGKLKFVFIFCHVCSVSVIFCVPR